MTIIAAKPGATGRDAALFPFGPQVDPAIALNEQARREGWPMVFDTTLAFRRPELCAVREVWRGLCRPGHLPARADLTMRVMKPFLRDVAIREVVTENGRRRYLHRLIGSAIAQRFGELTGVYLDQFLPPELYKKTAHIFDTIVDQRFPLRMVTDFELHAVDYARSEVFAAPLADDGVNANMLITVAYFQSKPAEPV